MGPSLDPFAVCWHFHGSLKGFLSSVVKLVLGSGLLAGGVYLTTDTFGRTWREFVIGELAQRGLHLDFRRLIINPVGGIVARDVQVFADAGRRQVLAEVNHLNLDFNIGRLMEGRFVVEGLELSHARVALPVEPESRPQDKANEHTVIEIEDLNARVFIQEGRLEIRQAEGRLAGIALNVTGELLLPSGSARDSKATPAEKGASLTQMADLGRHRLGIRKALDWLGRFSFTRSPKLSLEIHGALAQPEEMVARLYFDADGLRYDSFTCDSLRAEVEYSAGMVDLTRFYLKDRLGEVNANANWTLGADDLRFHLTSSADIPGLASAFLSNEKLREIVFYEPPHLALEGVWHVGGGLAGHKRPVHVTGRLECGRFGTRGELFEGLKAMIGVAPEGVYIRDLLLRHKSGTLAAQSLVHEQHGTRYDLVLRMDPRAFLPFAQMKQTREIIQRFEFSPESSIHFELTGSGPEPDPQQCLNKGRGDLRRFKYKGLYLDELQADVEFKHPMQNYRNVKIRRPEGVGEVRSVEVHDEEKWVKLDGVKSAMDPVGVVGVFGPKTAEIIARYRLPNTTRVEMDGTLFYRAPEKNDFRVKFSHPTGSGRYSLLNDDHIINAPVGDLVFKQTELTFDVSGQLYGGPMSARGTVDLRPDVDGFSVEVKAARFMQEIFNKKVPFEKVRAVVKETGALTKVDIGATLLDGGFTLKGSFGGARGPESYTGDMELKNLSLARFSDVFMRGNDSQGDVTGYFKFTGQLRDWSALKGSGALTILNGDLYSIPIVGVLAPMLGTILPKQIAGYNIAKEADCTFEVADGNLVTKNFEALTSTFKILLDGRIDFLRDILDMDAQVRVRGLPGIVFLPFSELLEYKGTGSVSDPRWEAKLFRGVERSPRQDSPREAMKEGEKPASQPAEPVLPRLKKALTPLFKSPGSR